jgi:RNA polymerase sigma factor (TIGR02999 family)
LDAPRPITHLLERWTEGDEVALAELMPMIDHELRRISHAHMSRERSGHVLQTTALVNEAYMRLVQQDVRWQNRAHFFGIAARIMRRILVDHARAQRVEKRGGGAEHVELDEVAIVEPSRSHELLALDAALDELATVDSRKARVVELRFFCGMSGPEIAEVLGVDERTIKRDWSTARAWLYQRLEDNGSP